MEVELAFLSAETLEANETAFSKQGGELQQHFQGREDKLLVVGDSGLFLPVRPRFPSVLSVCLHLCRRLRLMRNERTGMLTAEDAHVAAADLLRRRNKEANSDDDGEVEVSDVLDVVRMAKAGKVPPQDAKDPSALAAGDYIKSLKSGNLVDPFGIVRMVREDLSKEEGGVLREALDKSVSCVLLVNPPSLEKGTVERELLEMMFPNAQVSLVTAESPLDDSVNGDSRSQDSKIVIQPAEGNVIPELKSSKRSNTSSYCRSLLAGYLRLLVNSRDEMALARVVCGPCGGAGAGAGGQDGGGVDRDAFAEVRKQARTTGMPMYQTIVSFVQKQRLGGKSYAPREDHPLSPYSKALSDLVDFVDKMQEKVEEEKSGEGAVKKLLGCLKSHLSVGAHRMRAGAMEAALAEAADAARQAEEAEEGWMKDSVDSTPQRGVGAGGSMAGRKNMKLAREVADRLCSTAPSKLNLHELLGKLPTSSETTTSSPAGFGSPLRNGKTPLAGVTLAKLLKTPSVGKDREEEGDAPLRKRLRKEAAEKDSKVTKPKSRQEPKEGRPRFEATLAWAPETSPVVAPSPGSERQAPTVEGPTLAARGGGGDSSPVSTKCSPIAEEVEEQEPSQTDKVLKEAREKAEEVLKDAKDHRKRAPKSTMPKKRSILKEIGNIKTSKPQKQEKKKPAGPALIKGQAKLTAFFTKS